jgi:anti-sigma regulatory factor (Ser/Thr protein kinase)
MKSSCHSALQGVQARPLLALRSAVLKGAGTRHRERIKAQEEMRTGMMTSDVRPLAGPITGSAWQCAWPGQPRPLDAGTLALVALPTSPFWARRYTRVFLDSCRGMSEDTAETAELLVSELVTNAVRFADNPARALRYSERANAGLISLSIRHFREALLIEVYDTGSNPPVRSRADEDAESGRGLMIVEALSKEWSYFFPPGGGKVVYCFVEIR